MKEHKFIENFDRVLRYYVRPLMLEAITKIAEGEPGVFDLINEYCEDNGIEYSGVKPKHSKNDKPILCNLKLDPQLTNEQIQEVAKTEQNSEERKELTKQLIDGMDVQAALKLLGYRWFEPKAIDFANAKKVAEILGVEKETLQVIKSTLFAMINTRNNGGAHFSNNSHMSEDEYNGKMLHVTSVFWDLKHLDFELFQEYRKFCERGTSDEIELAEAEEKRKKRKKLMILISVAIGAILSVMLVLSIIDSIYSLDNKTRYVSNKLLTVKENGEIQILPYRIYCKNDQLHLEVWIGNGTSEELKSISFDLKMRNSANEEMISTENLKYQLSEPIPSMRSKTIKLIYNANEVSNKDSDLSTILWSVKIHED